jgi:hypothetical protein
MIDSSLYVMIFDACRSITWASGRGLGPRNLELFGPQMALALAHRLDAISRRAQKLNFEAQRPLTFPSKGSARIKTIAHGAV